MRPRTGGDYPTEAARGPHADALLPAVIAAARALMEDPTPGTALPNALAALGAGTGAERAFLHQYDVGARSGTLVAEWSAPGVAGSVATIGVPTLGTLDDRQDVIRQRPDLVLFAVRVDDRLWGHLGFTDPSTGRVGSDAVTEAFRGVAAMIGTSLGRGAAEQARMDAAAHEGRVAEARAAELAQANDMLRHTAARLTAGLASAADADAVLAVFLREVVAVAGAAAGAVLRRVVSTEFEFVALLDSGVIATGRRLRDIPMAAVMPEVSRADPSGCFGLIVSGETTLWTLAELDRWYPEYVAYWQARGVESVWHVPFTLQGDVVGYLGLAFRGGREPGGVVRDAVTALAGQIGLALELTRLVEQAKVGIVNAERDRMAREIHDTLAQGFAGVLLQLQLVKRETPDLPAAAAERLDAVMSLARENLIEARQAFGRLRARARLRPAFADALRQLVATARRASAVAITETLDASVDWLPGDVETELLRIVQEALTNALTHGQGHAISLEMTGTRGGVCVVVQDTGRGFDPDTREDGFGLTSMSERAAHIGASLTVASAPGEGTEVIVAWPVEAPAPDPRQPP